ncbi:MAG: tetratricopeptide repeat protein [Candidatus Omnitrophota bacterium]
MKKIVIFVVILILFVFSFSFAFEDSKETELLFMAKKAYEDGFYEVSLGMLDRFQKNFKDSLKIQQVRLLTGQCYFNQGRYLEALNILESLVNDPQANDFKDAIYFWMAEVHFKGGNFSKSAALYQKLITEFGQSSYCPDAYYSLGWSYAQVGQYKLALQVFRQLLEKFPDEPQSKDAAFKLIECLYNLKEYSELKNKIKPIFKLYTKDPLRLPYLYFYLGESEYYLNNLDEATKNYLKAAQTFKDQKLQSLAKLGLGWSLLKLNKYKETEDVFLDIKQDVLERKSLDILILGQASLMSVTNRIYEAKKLYDQLINLTSDPLILTQAWLGKADAFYNLAEYTQAVDSYKDILDKINKNRVKFNIPEELIEKLNYNLGLAYIKQGQVDTGNQILKTVMAKRSDKGMQANLSFQIGEAYAAAGEFLKAEEIYREILKLNPDASYADYAQYQIGLLQLKELNYDESIFSFELMLKKYVQSKFLPDAVYSLGLAYFQKMDYRKSCEIFAKFQNEFKDSALRAQAFYMLGTSLLSLGKIKEALDIFISVPKLDPQDVQLLQKVEYEIADCYYKLGQEDEAADRFKLLRTKYPDSKLTADIMWWLGQYYYRGNDLNLARRYFSSLIKDSLNSHLAADAYYALGLTFSDENKFQQAMDNFKMAIELGGKDLKVQAALALGDIYIRQGSIEDALVQYKKLVKDNPDLAKVLFPRIAEVYYKAADYESAKLFYSKSLEVVDDNEIENIRFNLAEVLEAKGELDASCKQYLLVADLNLKSPEYYPRSLLRAAKLYEDKEDWANALKIYNRIQKSTEETKFAQEKIEWIKTNIRK